MVAYYKQCDEVRPFCTPCRKTGRNCPGYPDEFDLIFRNENNAVARRVKRASTLREHSQTLPSRYVRRHSTYVEAVPTSPAVETESPETAFGYFLKDTVGIVIDEDIDYLPSLSPPKHSSRSSTVGSDDWTQNVVSTLTTDSDTLPSELALTQAYAWALGSGISPCITPSTEAQATAFFFRNFVLLPQEAESMRGFLELILPLYNTASHSSPLHSITHCVALSVLGNYPGRQHMVQEATVKYGEALQKVREAVKNPDLAKTDETLLSVMMFSLYEVHTAIAPCHWSILGRRIVYQGKRFCYSVTWRRG